MAQGAECSQGALGCVETDMATQTKAFQQGKPCGSAGAAHRARIHEHATECYAPGERAGLCQL